LYAKYSTGDHTENYFKHGYGPDDTIKYCTLKKGARKRRHNRMEISSASDCVNGAYDKSALAKDYKGTLVVDADIVREYRLVPQNKELRAEYLKAQRSIYKNMKYEAIVKGDSFELDPLGIKVRPDGRHLKFPFNVYYTGGRKAQPWIDISLTLPNLDYHYGDLRLWGSHIDQLKIDIVEYTQSIASNKGKRNKLKDERQKLIQERNTLRECNGKKCLTVMEPGKNFDEIIQDELKEQLTTSINLREEEAVALITSITNNHEKIADLKNEKEKLQKQQALLQTKKRNLAIILITRDEESTAVKELSELVENETKEELSGDADTVQSYVKKFVTKYESNHQAFYKEAGEILSAV